MKFLCIYHADCTDGFAAAWAVHRTLGDSVKFAAYQYQEPFLPLYIGMVTNCHVLIVDFSFPLNELLGIAQVATSLVILDHHHTAASDLATLPPPGHEVYEQFVLHGGIRPRTPAAIFDVNRSGAGITWDFVHGGERPWIIDAVEDRDLWRFKRPGTREIHAALGIEPRTLEHWDNLYNQNKESDLIAKGAVILAAHDANVKTVASTTVRWMRLGGVLMPIANAPHFMASDVGRALCDEYQQCAGSYFDSPRGRRFSLRSDDLKHDVSVIAKSYGGGGHRNAAGFKAPIGYEGDE